ncbi:MAG: ferredoxin--NADP reductase [Acidobacteriota bacterium]
MKDSDFNAVVLDKREVAPGLYILRVAPEGWRLPAFRAGQFAVLGLPASAPRHPLSDPEDEPPREKPLIRRSYSIASSSRDSEFLEFYLTVVRSGSLTPRLAMLEAGERLWLGPRISGLFTFDGVPGDVNVVMMATGTGLAPYMSMLRTHLDADQPRRIAALHGARHSWDLGYRSELIAMERAHPNFTYVAVVSRPDEEPVPWGGEVGRLQDLWRRRVVGARWGVELSPENCHVMLCGNPEMIEEMIALLGGEGYREHRREDPGQIHVEKYW